MGSDLLPRGGGREAIEALIPHRPPFLFVDRIIDRGPNSITVERDVDPGEPHFRGHYPGFPILPGVLISEFCFQGAALLLADPESTQASDGTLPVLTKITEARFRKAVRPGETLRAKIELSEKISSARYMKARVTSGGSTVLSLSFVVSAVSRERLAAQAGT